MNSRFTVFDDTRRHCFNGSFFVVLCALTVIDTFPCREHIGCHLCEAQTKMCVEQRDTVSGDKLIYLHTARSRPSILVWHGSKIEFPIGNDGGAAEAARSPAGKGWHISLYSWICDSRSVWLDEFARSVCTSSKQANRALYKYLQRKLLHNFLRKHVTNGRMYSIHFGIFNEFAFIRWTTGPNSNGKNSILSASLFLCGFFFGQLN